MGIVAIWESLRKQHIFCLLYVLFFCNGRETISYSLIAAILFSYFAGVSYILIRRIHFGSCMSFGMRDAIHSAASFLRNSYDFIRKP